MNDCGRPFGSGEAWRRARRALFTPGPRFLAETSIFIVVCVKAVAGRLFTVDFSRNLCQSGAARSGECRCCRLLSLASVRCVHCCRIGRADRRLRSYAGGRNDLKSLTDRSRQAIKPFAGAEGAGDIQRVCRLLRNAGIVSGALPLCSVALRTVLNEKAALNKTAENRKRFKSHLYAIGRFAVLAAASLIVWDYFGPPLRRDAVFSALCKSSDRSGSRDAAMFGPLRSGKI